MRRRMPPGWRRYCGCSPPGRWPPRHHPSTRPPVRWRDVAPVRCRRGAAWWRASLPPCSRSRAALRFGALSLERKPETPARKTTMGKRYSVYNVVCGKCGARFGARSPQTRLCGTCHTATGRPVYEVACVGCGQQFTSRHVSTRRCDNCHDNKMRAAQKTRRQSNPTKAQDDKRKYRERHREQVRAYMRAYYARNSEKVKAKRQQWKDLNREHVRDYKREYEKRSVTDDRKKMIRTVRSRVAVAVRSSIRKGRPVTERGAMRYLGCSIVDFMAHLESQFAPDMGWHNFGKQGWHIDHVFPVVAADLSDPAQLRAVFNWRNCRPAWGHDNYRKGRTVSDEARALFEELADDFRRTPRRG